jgi:hypothetical protein
MKLKSVGADGTFTGIAAVANNIDLGGDKIMPGAFTRTLAAGKQLPLLWQHDPALPIGTVKCTETSQGSLQVDGALLLSVPQAVTAYELLKAGVLKGMSIGFDTVKSTFDGDVRLLQELRLWEVSIVTFPMNEDAMVTSVKAMSDSDRQKHLKSISDHVKAIGRHQRGLREHLKSLCDAFDDASGDDLALLEDEGDDDETKSLLIELQKMTQQASSDLNGSTDAPWQSTRMPRVFGCR